MVSWVVALAASAAAAFDAFGLSWPVPPWLIWITCTLILMVTNFLTYHRMRLKMIDEETAVKLPPHQRERIHRIRDNAVALLPAVADRDPNAAKIIKALEEDGYRLPGHYGLMQMVRAYVFCARDILKNITPPSRPAKKRTRAASDDELDRIFLAEITEPALHDALLGVLLISSQILEKYPAPEPRHRESGRQ